MSTIYFRRFHFNSIDSKMLNELFILRKHVFSDRLNWDVQINSGKEKDIYDNKNATYLLAFHNDVIIAGTRFIETINPYMLQGFFQKYFQKTSPQQKTIVEASRFFIDKDKIRELNLQSEPITALLLLYMYEMAKKEAFQSILAIVSKPMARIIRNNGWSYKIEDKGQIKSDETIFWINMPVLSENYTRLNQFIKRNINELKYHFGFD